MKLNKFLLGAIMSLLVNTGYSEDTPVVLKVELEPYAKLTDLDNVVKFGPIEDGFSKLLNVTNFYAASPEVYTNSIDGGVYPAAILQLDVNSDWDLGGEFLSPGFAAGYLGDGIVYGYNKISRWRNDGDINSIYFPEYFINNGVRDYFLTYEEPKLFTFGDNVYAYGTNSISLGTHAITKEYGSSANRTYDINTFIWNGDSTKNYNSHGSGTFSINPKPLQGSNDPASGFYIGETNLIGVINKFAPVPDLTSYATKTYVSDQLSDYALDTNVVHASYNSNRGLYYLDHGIRHNDGFETFELDTDGIYFYQNNKFSVYGYNSIGFAGGNAEIYNEGDLDFTIIGTITFDKSPIAWNSATGNSLYLDDDANYFVISNKKNNKTYNTQFNWPIEYIGTNSVNDIERTIATTDMLNNYVAFSDYGITNVYGFAVGNNTIAEFDSQEAFINATDAVYLFGEESGLTPSQIFWNSPSGRYSEFNWNNLKLHTEIDAVDIDYQFPTNLPDNTLKYIALTDSPDGSTGVSDVLHVVYDEDEGVFKSAIGDYPFDSMWYISNLITRIESESGTYIDLSTEESMIRIYNGENTLCILNSDPSNLGGIGIDDLRGHTIGSYLFPYDNNSKYFALTSNSNGVPEVNIPSNMALTKTISYGNVITNAFGFDYIRNNDYYKASFPSISSYSYNNDNPIILIGNGRQEIYEESMPNDNFGSAQLVLYADHTWTNTNALTGDLPGYTIITEGESPYPDITYGLQGVHFAGYDDQGEELPYSYLFPTNQSVKYIALTDDPNGVVNVDMSNYPTFNQVSNIVDLIINNMVDNGGITRNGTNYVLVIQPN